MHSQWKVILTSAVPYRFVGYYVKGLRFRTRSGGVGATRVLKRYPLPNDVYTGAGVLRVETKDIELRILWVETRGGQLLSIANITKIETMSMVYGPILFQEMGK